MNVQPFNFNENSLSVIIDENNNPLFIAKEVTEILGYRTASDAVRILDEDEKLIRTLCVAGQNRDVNLITESGLYSLILRSKKPEAKAFKKWVTSEVIPSIRKTGSYSNTPQFNIPQTYPEALKLAYEQSVQIEQQKKVINTQQHYVNFAERCFDENLEDVSSISETAKKLDLPYGSKTLYKVLRFYGMLTKNNKDRNEPKQEFVNRGYFLLKQTSYENKEGKQFINNVVYVTQKGLAYLTARRNKLVCPIMLDIVNKNAA